MIVAITSLVVATAGTATAASVVISNSSQVKNGALRGSDLANRTVTGLKIANGTISGAKIRNGTVTPSKLSSSVRRQLGGAAPAGLTASEAVRRSGPDNVAPGTARIASVKALQPGTYIIMAKTTIESFPGDIGLGELLRENKTATAECTLEVGGDVDKARGATVTPTSSHPHTLNMQMTRTIGTAADAVLTCGADHYRWRAADSSVVAIRLAGSTRVETAD